MGATVLFYLFAVLAVFGATMVITRNHPIHSAVSLLGTFAAVAALYILLDAPFIAMVQITVYAGAILVLILFTIMLLNLREAEGGFLHFAKGGHGIATLAFSALLIAELVYVLVSPDARPASVPGNYPDAVLQQVGHTQALGEMLFTKYVWPFEVVSVLLIVAIVGAVVLTRHRKTAQFAVYAPEGEEDAAGPKTGA